MTLIGTLAAAIGGVIAAERLKPFFLSLLDPDRVEGRLRGKSKVGHIGDLMRRSVKEKLLTFDGKPLFPERVATTAQYDLSPLEQKLYEAVTHYVREGMNRAARLEEGGDRKRGLIVGFALAALQRRLASPPHAIYRSIQRRKERLEKRLVELQTFREDLAAGTLIVREAGGIISGLDGSEDFLNTGHVLTGTPKIYTALAKQFGPDIKVMFA